MSQKDDDEDKLSHPTGKFIRPKKIQSSGLDDNTLDQPTQKIIIFPTEASQALPDSKPQNKDTMMPPIIFTAPLPKIDDLPEDFLDADELEEHHAQVLPPDFSQFLKGDDIEVEYPVEQKKIAQFLKELEAKADDYADQMFTEAETEDVEEIERIERLIPGTDYEEGKRSLPPSRQKSKIKKKKMITKKVPPEIDIISLGKQLKKPLTSMRKRRLSLFFLMLLTSSLTFFSDTLLESVSWLESTGNQMLFLGLSLLCGLALSYDRLYQGFIRGLQLKVGVDTMCLFGGIFTFVDCIIQGTTENPRGQLPYVTLILLHLVLLLFGEEEKRRSYYRSCTVAQTLETPSLITLEPRKWNSKPAFTKSSDTPTGFTSQLQEEDGCQEFHAFSCSIFLLASFLTALYITGNTEDFVWAFSALLLVSTPLGSLFFYGRASNKVSIRLKELSATLVGWGSISKSGKQCIISDTDLFPAGTVEISGARILPGFNERKVLAFTAALLQEGDYGCSPLFHTMLVKRNLTPPKVRDPLYHEGGGISAFIGTDTVMVGSAHFMELMHISVPEGTFMSNTIFISINNRLAGIFSLEYSLSLSVSQSLENLLQEKIQPVLATRDFALTPDYLRHRFRINTDRMAFPTVTRRRELSSSDRPQEGILTAILLREGLEPLADSVIAARRLRQTILQCLSLSLAASLLGFILVAYLISAQAYTSLSAGNLMFFLALWLPPFVVLSDLPQRF